MYGVALAAGRIKPRPFDEDDLPTQSSFIKKFDNGKQLSLEQIYYEELDVEVYRDIFTKNDRLLEEIAINRLSKILRRESVAILKEVVGQATTDSKILAATALIEMESKIIKKIDALRRQLSQKPNDIETMLELARIYDLYCFLDVLDEIVQEYYRALAIEQYRTYLIQRPKDPQVTLEYGRTLLHAGDVEKAVRVLQSAASLAPHNPNPYIWLAEAHFISKNYSDIPQICNRIKDFFNLPEAARPVLDLWTGQMVYN
jgi:thioredoxin-like negative regulator of GroEL